ncbi:Sec-independent protein translocase protein TatB [Brevundimonas aveniformis]|uniref:Sec-independent protein translocase protein TatB n=1 Tax=Brevundimonas aveniformis TaxID=370977 RepID=UPI0004234FB7
MLGPGIGGFELVVIALVALIVVGPKDLPLLMRRVGQMLGRARKMAAEFRASFDDMARQSELDDLRKEVEALRSGQLDGFDKGAVDTFKDIDAELKKPLASSPEMKKLPPASAEMEAVIHTPPMTEPSLPDSSPQTTTKPRPKGTKPSKPRAPRKKAGA